MIKELQKLKIILLVVVTLLMFDLLLTKPSLSFDLLSPTTNQIYEKRESFAGSDFIYYLSAARDFSVQTDPRAEGEIQKNNGMRWLYPPPILELLASSRLYEHPKASLALALCVFMICVMFIARFAVNTILSYERKIIKKEKILMLIVCYIGYPPFFIAAIDALNVGTILLVIALSQLIIHQRPSLAYYISTGILAYIKPQYAILLLIESVSEKRIIKRELVVLGVVILTHLATYLSMTESYQNWLNSSVLNYALQKKTTGLWLMSLYGSENQIKVLIAIAIGILLIASYIKYNPTESKISNIIFGFLLCMLVMPRIYEYELNLIPILVLTHLGLRRSEPKLIFYLTAMALVLLYRLVTIAYGGNYYTPSASQALMALFVLLIYSSVNDVAQTRKTQSDDSK